MWKWLRLVRRRTRKNGAASAHLRRSVEGLFDARDRAKPQPRQLAGRSSFQGIVFGRGRDCDVRMGVVADLELDVDSGLVGAGQPSLSEHVPPRRWRPSQAQVGAIGALMGNGDLRKRLWMTVPSGHRKISTMPRSIRKPGTLMSLVKRRTRD